MMKPKTALFDITMEVERNASRRAFDYYIVIGKNIGLEKGDEIVFTGRFYDYELEVRYPVFGEILEEKTGTKMCRRICKHCKEENMNNFKTPIYKIKPPDTMSLIDFLQDYLSSYGIAPGEYPKRIVILKGDVMIQLPLDGDTGGMVDLGFAEREFTVDRIIYDKAGDLLVTLEWG